MLTPYSPSPGRTADPPECCYAAVVSAGREQVLVGPEIQEDRYEEEEIRRSRKCRPAIKRRDYLVAREEEDEGVAADLFRGWTGLDSHAGIPTTLRAVRTVSPHRLGRVGVSAVRTRVASATPFFNHSQLELIIFWFLIFSLGLKTRVVRHGIVIQVKRPTLDIFRAAHFRVDLMYDEITNKCNW